MLKKVVIDFIDFISFYDFIIERIDKQNKKYKKNGIIIHMVINLRIAISSTGKDLNADVDSRFGRCPYFLIVDIDEKNKETNSFKSIENEGREAGGGAGITSAELVANENPDAVISKNIGPKAFQIFEQLKIRVFNGEGRIKDVIERFLDGKLEEIKSTMGRGRF